MGKMKKTSFQGTVLVSDSTATDDQVKTQFVFNGHPEARNADLVGVDQRHL